MCLERNNVDIVCNDDCEPRDDWDFSTECTCYVGRGEEIICERIYARTNLCPCQIFRFGRPFPVPLSTTCRLSEDCSCELANLGIERCDPEMDRMSPDMSMPDGMSQEMDRMSPDLSMSDGMSSDMSSMSAEEDDETTTIVTTTTEGATSSTEPISTTTGQSTDNQSEDATQTASTSTTEETPTTSTEGTSTT